jgi:hypothetical protein
VEARIESVHDQSRGVVDAFAQSNEGLLVPAGQEDAGVSDDVCDQGQDLRVGEAQARLDADLRLHRKSLKDGTTVLSVVNGVLAAAWIVPVAVLSAVAQTTPDAAPLAVLAVTMGALQAGVSTLIWRGIKKSFRDAMMRTQLRLEQLLDALEHGDAGSPPSLLEQLKQSLSSTRL